MADASPNDMIVAETPAVIEPSKRARLLRMLGIAVVVAALVWGVWYYLTQAGRVETDNAYVGADTAQVTALISGPVAEVRVGGTQIVRKGDVLVVLDPADAKVDVATAEAALFQAQQRYGQAAAQVGSARAKLASRGADIAQARARVAEANAGYERARVELARREALAGSGAVSADELSAARAAFATARASRDLAGAGVASAQATSLSADSDLIATEALIRGTSISTAPDVAAARARLDAARLNLERTVIRAPIDGVVTNRQVQIGQRIAAGVPIMTIVPVARAFVDANFKESQLRRVRVGMPVELTSDFYGSSVVFHGKVAGFSGGTGAAFALIPAQNATGNWVKVVQRLPVRVSLDPDEVRAHPLRVGLTMTATIDTRGK
ncbi:HlyD family efflux transporter periplasmic adaptor subunit [Sphingomonas sp. SUN039]|uniref:HlyD family efflux transporter periplasmic adaptor subunit n=1 Tax=Sphingomonas sp. SUN039 TaxID=2937787 RepID=UPI0021644C90|nr:HlyD family efflux transporter periplasmic adaptor subunit [Sphingomonas sp. SUN039]UVO55184.1 HlyD family efflux transporter periplasmic adaptor subunit [Sphingomonas sp. SUN039]